jgi:hypothetical protein
MSLARLTRFERLFDRLVPVVLVALSVSLAAATVSVGA